MLWAPCNMDISRPNGFADSPYQYECSFFSWGNVDGHNPSSNNSFSPWDWGGVNPSAPYYDGQVYGSTPGALLEGDIPPSHDAAAVLIGRGWRMPSASEFGELFNNCDIIDADGDIIESTDKRTTMYGVVGLRLRSKVNGNVIFFTTSGVGSETSWYYRGSNGGYWSSTWGSARYARRLVFSHSGVDRVGTSNRFSGFAIRPVIDPASP